MKKITLIIFFYCSILTAQTNNYYWPDTNNIRVYGGTLTYTAANNELPTYDTIKCNLLITECDGCQCKSYLGYVITKTPWFNSDGYFYGEHPVTFIIGYLDIKKKPFNKQTIIWLPKN